MPKLLDTQYRMHPSIAGFTSRLFYDGKLRSGIKASSRPAPKGAVRQRCHPFGVQNACFLIKLNNKRIAPISDGIWNMVGHFLLQAALSIVD